jgi:hypothetical protein
MDATLDVNEREVSVREAMSAFSGLAVLCVLVAVLAASTFIASGEGAGSQGGLKSPPNHFGGSDPIPSTTFYLFESEAQVEEVRSVLELAADQVGRIPLQTYPHVVTLVASTEDEEAQAYARIVERVRSSRAQQLNIDVVDLREPRPR